MNTIIKEIFQDNTFEKDKSELLYSKLKKIDLKRGAFLLKADDEVHDLYYVHSGCLRSYIIDPEGREHILQFAVKGWWISDYIALFGRTKTNSVSYIECINNATIFSISKSDFDMLCRAIPEVAHFHIRKMEMAFASFQNRILDNIKLPAKQRYINFVSAYPDIANDVKNYHIASYIGITTESLSRIRKEISSP